jgi:hypothetical protein
MCLKWNDQVLADIVTDTLLTHEGIEPNLILLPPYQAMMQRPLQLQNRILGDFNQQNPFIQLSGKSKRLIFTPESNATKS